MRFFFVILLFFFKLEILYASEKIAFIDLNYIMNNSISGKSIINFMNDIKKKKIDELRLIEDKIKKDENELIAKKNIIEENLYKQKVEKIKLRIKDYKNNRQNFNKSLDQKNINLTNKLLEKLNPIISEYVEENSISVVFPKKMIIVGRKKLDITLPILDILDKNIQKINFDEQ
tara:strand:+ start:156 stop:677 length:522 start_codon:yes stop_codon:yes gene_type:complete